MNKRFSTAQIMRVISILGIICLLALQWVWWRNAYRAVEMDFLKKTEECLNLGIEKALMQQINKKSKGIKVVSQFEGEKLDKHIKVMPGHSANNTTELKYVIEDMLSIIKQPISEKAINANFSQELKDKFDFVPNYHSSIIRLNNKIDVKRKSIFNRIAIGTSKDTIYQQVGFKSYIIVTIASPTKLYIKKGAAVLVVSLLMVLLIGAILMFQYLNLVRDRKFAEFIKDYTRMMTHELKTPISGIKMALKILNKELPAKEREQYIQNTENLTNKVILNLDNILYMAMSEQRDLPLNKFQVDVPKFMEKLVKTYREMEFNPKKVSIDTFYEPAEFYCVMDIELMERVFCNLLENAIKYTGMDAHIIIQCKQEGDMTTFSVEDNGIGMTSEDQSNIFKIFERGNISKNNLYQGFGIGLHFVDRVIKAHGGKISVTSTKNVGSIFTIKILS